MIRENKDTIIDGWLQRVSVNPELSRVNLSDVERRDHVPDLLEEAISHACGDLIDVENRQKAAERHGTLRYHQGYSVTMLILEAQLLQEVIAECIRDHIGALDIAHLITDIAKVSDIITGELRESVRSYMSQHEWHSGRPDKRSGGPVGTLRIRQSAGGKT